MYVYIETFVMFLFRNKKNRKNRKKQNKPDQILGVQGFKYE